MDFEIVTGDLLDQPVEVIVNPWNRNIIPWWLLLPHGVSGAIKRRAGYRPFVEVGWNGPIPLGGAALTSAGKLPFRGIIHVAGIDMLWRSSAEAVQRCVANTMRLVNDLGFRSVAFPLIGAGVGGLTEDEALGVMTDALQPLTSGAEARIVIFAEERAKRP